MKYWVEQRADGGYAWHKRSDPLALYVLIGCHTDGWAVTCTRSKRSEAQYENFASRRPDELGLDQCLTFVVDTLIRQGAPYFDVVEAKHVLLSLDSARADNSAM